VIVAEPLGAAPHETVALAAPAVALVFAGAPGLTTADVILMVVEPAGPAPFALKATTLNVWGFPFVSPEMLAVRPGSHGCVQVFVFDDCNFVPRYVLTTYLVIADP
jgi:hypothetical protein